MVRMEEEWEREDGLRGGESGVEVEWSSVGAPNAVT